MDISIIIPSKDRNKILFESLERAYKAIENVTAEIIVINDSKTDDIDLKATWLDKVKVYKNPKSGVASARNLGASKAIADLLLFMDDDMWISEENINCTLQLHKLNSENCCFNLNWIYPPQIIAILEKSQFGRYLTYYGFDSLKGWNKGGTWKDDCQFEADGVTSQYLSINRTDFLRVGGYNEGFPHAGFEDHDFGKRLKQAGVRTYIYPSSMVYHNEADRMDIKLWLARKLRGGETRRVAVSMGYKELAYDYGFLKPLIYKTMSPFQESLLQVLEAIPNSKNFDNIYFRVLNLLLGLSSFNGYTKNTKK